ncbi:MAG: dCTP deaminase [Candidatus Aerophobetes bacterium]|nr:dCTP deaminase [Candidatus Aerophobetes bacterium]
MILVDEEIKKAVDSGEIELSDFSEECLQPASYDMRVGEEGFTLSAGIVINIQNEGELKIQPGDFALVMTHEKLQLPANMLGRFGLRSLYARMGLLATAGPQVDPGFGGKLVIGIVNFSSQSIMLPYLTPFCSLELYRLQRCVRVSYKGPYQGQEHLTDKIISKLPREPFPLAVMLIRQLVASSPSIGPEEASTLYRRELPRGLVTFQREKQAFERLKPELLKTHRGQYVVIREKKAVLFGHSKTELIKQAYSQFGYGPLYIGLVGQEQEVVHIPTPRVPRRMA